MHRVYVILITGLLLFGCKQIMKNEQIAETKPHFNRDLVEESKKMIEIAQVDAFQSSDDSYLTMEKRERFKDNSVYRNKSSELKNQNKKKQIFYIHGRIIEQQGKAAYSEVFGKYELDGIISALEFENTVVHCDIRNENVDPRPYAIKISSQIDSLINLGIKPRDITVIGASKGAIIASNVSDLNLNPINYVMLAGNNDYQETNNKWKFHGQVLCIYDLSDDIAGKNYDYWKNNENYTTKFEQLELKTNLGHGFLYKPLKAWVEPAKKWVLTQRL